MFAAITCIECKLTIVPASDEPLQSVLRDLVHEGAMIEDTNPGGPVVTCPSCAVL